MRKLLKYLVLLPFIAAVACSGPAKVIPDDTLSDILSEIYLVNAYANDIRNVDFDSVNIYEPILNRYGYTSKDFTHTLANFTKRKSAKLAPIIDRANDKLDVMLAQVNKAIEKEDYIDSLAWALTKRTVYADSLIQARRIADTASLRITIPAERGTYNISYNYLQDSVDTNTNLISRHYLKDTDGKTLTSTTQRIVRGRAVNNYQTKLEADDKVQALELHLGGYREKELKEPLHLTFDSLEVVWLPPRQFAREQYLKQFVNFRFMVDSVDIRELLHPSPYRDSLALEVPAFDEPADTEETAYAEDTMETENTADDDRTEDSVAPDISEQETPSE